MAFLDNILKKDQTKDANKTANLSLKTNVPVLLKRPYMTEKASILAESGKYVFEIDFIQFLLNFGIFISFLLYKFFSNIYK